MDTRDIVVIGASAGGLDPLRRIAADLEPELPASVFVVLHILPSQPSVLDGILSRSGPLESTFALDGEPIRRGHIYVAPPDFHLMVDERAVRVVQGPPENRHRPSVDVLFRSAARFYGPRVIGVVLSGSLDDGTAGLVAVKVRGGVAVVQDPSEAYAADMPRSAMRYLDIDHLVPADAIGPLLNRLTRERVDDGDAEPPTPEMVQETRIARLDAAALESEEHVGTQSVFACPDCSGVLWEIQEGDLIRFRCRTGHAYSPATLLDAQEEGIEKALFMAIRSIEERLDLRRRLVEQARSRRLHRIADEWERRASELEDASRALRVLLQKKTPVPAEIPAR